MSEHKHSFGATHFEPIALIPRPVHLLQRDGHYALDGEKIIWARAAPEVGGALAGWLSEEAGVSLTVDIAGDGPEAAPEGIRLAIRAGIEGEGYRLDVAETGITIHAGREAGLYYGAQTLRQLASGAGAQVRVPCVTIDDKPRFGWRGLHLDVARHFFPVPFIKRYLDLMAGHKFNVFHWHLTDDQGWRIEIKRFPRLTEVGAWRASTPIPAERAKGDGRAYGGFYTQDEIRDVVAYAQARHITVVPEIEMPGHARAALASYPELGCRGGPYDVWTEWGIADDVFCAGNEATFDFVEAVLGEVMALFPGRFIHVGGDECPKSRWRACSKCQMRMRQEGLNDEDQLQSYFMRRVGAFLAANGRRLVGWDEILAGGLPPDAVVMSWRGLEGGIEAATQGHDVVMSPTDHCYFDYYQSADRSAEPPAIGGLITLKKVLAFDPLAGVAEEGQHHILGGQGNVWTEYIPTSAQVEYMTYPRAAALAEVLWAGGGGDYLEFRDRLRVHLRRMDRQDVNYRPLQD